MSYTPLPNPLPVKLLTEAEVLTEILAELRIMNHYLYSLPKLLNSGTEQPASDDPDRFRQDPATFLPRN